MEKVSCAKSLQHTTLLLLVRVRAVRRWPTEAIFAVDRGHWRSASILLSVIDSWPGSTYEAIPNLFGTQLPETHHNFVSSELARFSIRISFKFACAGIVPSAEAVCKIRGQPTCTVNLSTLSTLTRCWYPNALP